MIDFRDPPPLSERSPILTRFLFVRLSVFSSDLSWGHPQWVVENSRLQNQIKSLEEQLSAERRNLQLVRGQESNAREKIQRLEGQIRDRDDILKEKDSQIDRLSGLVSQMEDSRETMVQDLQKQVGKSLSSNAYVFALDFLVSPPCQQHEGRWGRRGAVVSSFIREAGSGSVRKGDAGTASRD